MRFKFPNKSDINDMYKVLKTFYNEDIFAFADRINQKIFQIKCDIFTATLVIDSKERRIDIFSTPMGMLTCHNMFSGNSAGLSAYGFYQYHIVEIEKSELDSFNCSRYFDKYRFYSKNGNILCYLSAKPGQVPFVCDEFDIKLLYLICDYLIHIKSFYDQNEEKPTTSEDEMVAVFEFDDENMEYNSYVEKLEYFDFSPNLNIKPYKDKNLIEKFKNIEIKEGTLHVGMGYGNHAFDTYEFSNDVFLSLNPIFIYGCNDEFFEYNISSTLYKNNNKNMKTQLLKLFENVGLYDTIVTSNPFIYQILEKNLKVLGIEVILDYDDFLIFVILMHLSFASDSGASFEETQLLLEKLKENFKEFVEFLNDKDYDIEKFLESMSSQTDNDIDELLEEDEDLEEDFDDEMYFETDSKDVC